MGNEHYEKAKPIKLNEIISPKFFRLIPVQLTWLNYGVSEIPIDIHVNEEFAKSLPYEVPWDGDFYGYIREKKRLFAKLGIDNAVKVTLSDWEGRFALIFEGEDKKEGPVFIVDPSDVRKLLTKCLRPEKIVED